jgi:hypothetical protein
MHFQLLAIVLWSHDKTLPPQAVSFTPGMVNVVMGLSRTGKSAVIPIIDYCLGAGTCAIPKKIVRAACSWFGILVETAEGQKLLARREPGGADASNDMFMLEGAEVMLPASIEEPNTSVPAVKRRLDQLAGLTQLPFGAKDSFDHRPSFRDLMAFVYQTQNVVANPSTLFYGADKPVHAIKLARNVLPYVLGAKSVENIAAAQEIDRLERKLARKENERKTMQKTSSRWETEISGYLEKASELGLIEPDASLDLAPERMLDLLRKVAQKTVDDFNADSSTITHAIEELARIEGEEAKLSEKIALLKARQVELARLREGAGGYQGALRQQRDRLCLSQWLKEQAGEHHCPLCRHAMPEDGRVAEELYASLQQVEAASARLEQLPMTVDREVHLVREGTDELFEQLNALRRRRKALTGSSAEAKARQFQSLNVAHFLGRLRQAITLYDETLDGGELAEEITKLKEELTAERKKVDEKAIAQRLELAVSKIADRLAQIMPQLDNDHPNDRALLQVENLTLRILGEEGETFLWAVGSGSNHLSYHVATLLALHSFLLERGNSPVPGLIIFDQPSQVYFPERLRGARDPNKEWQDDADVQAVRKVFKVLGQAAERSQDRLQIIVMDHAPAEVWGDLTGVALAVDWRNTGRKLVPVNWPGAQG